MSVARGITETVTEQREWLDKAEQSLRGAESEFANQRYDNAANRAYYACFHAAIAALIGAGEHPLGEKGTRSHSAIQAMFAGLLIRRRKIYPADLASVLPDSYSLRDQADYTITVTSELEAKRALDKARRLVNAVGREVKRFR